MFGDKSIEELKKYLSNYNKQVNPLGGFNLSGEYDEKTKKVKGNFTYVGKKADLIVLSLIGLAAFAISSYTKISLAKIAQ